MIKLSNNHIIDFIAASGSLGFDGQGYWWEQPLKLVGLLDTNLFTPITKTLTYLPRNSNCRFKFNCVKFIKNGILNSMGLPNPGIDKWITDNQNFNGIVSIYPGNDYHVKLMLEKLNQLPFIKAIELNVSCSNVLPNNDYCFDFDGYEIEQIIKETSSVTTLPLILKLSVTHRIENLFKSPSLYKCIEAISINSVPWSVIYPDKKSPLEKYGKGALSGKIAQCFTWPFIKQIRSKTNIPIIGCSVWEYNDIQKLYDIGCSAIGFGSIFLRYPWRPTQFVRKQCKIENIRM